MATASQRSYVQILSATNQDPINYEVKRRSLRDDTSALPLIFPMLFTVLQHIGINFLPSDILPSDTQPGWMGLFLKF